MNTRLSRRHLLILTGGAALGAGLARASTSHAQTTSSPFTFASGSELTWQDPWNMNDQNLVTGIVADSATLTGGNEGEVALGFYDAPQTIDDVATAFLTFLLGDASLAKPIAGGGEESIGAGGVVESKTDFQVYSLTVDDADWGIYIQLVNDVELSVFVAPAAAFAAELASAQESIQIDGKRVFDGTDAAEYERFPDVAAPAAFDNEYTDATGFLHVTWTNTWSEIEQNDEGIILTNQDDSIRLFISQYPLEGMTWEEMAKVDSAFLYDDQGADATLIGPAVTDNGFSFVTDGEYGPRFAQGSATEDPGTYVLAFAANFETGIDLADAAVLVQDAQANVKVNGTRVLLGLEKMI